jgi:hypothetical protein
MSGPPGPTVEIGRLSLHAGAMSEADARRLAELVGLGLARLPYCAGPARDHVAVSVPAEGGVAEIAAAAVGAIEAALRAEGAS